MILSAISLHSHVAELSNQTKCQLPAHITESNQQPNFSRNSRQNFSCLNQDEPIDQNQSSGFTCLFHSELQSGQCNTSELSTSNFYKNSSSKNESHQPKILLLTNTHATDHELPNQFKTQSLPQNTDSNQQSNLSQNPI